jgi:uncharacterized protein
MQHMVVPQGFEVQLFASDPDLGGKPIAMTWDERGRLWVLETYDYPNELQPPGQGRDRIRICEDTNGDGRADKFTVFAEQLSIPSSLTFVRDGVLVQNGTETLLFKDTNGDDIADERHVVFTGWALGDTHGGVSNFQYGLDNWIWAMQGYNNSQPVVNGQRQQGFRQGFFRFRPDGTELEFIRSTNNNTWGIGISEEGIIFGSTANRNPSVYMPIPNRYYEAVQGWTSSLTLGTMADSHRFRPITDRVRQMDHHGGYTAGAGHALYTARVYPEEYWNRVAFVCGPTGHLVGSFVISRRGADFHSTSPFNLLASQDEWTAPIMAEVGPDGNVWVIDWYNFIIQHNPTPIGFQTGRGNAYETDLRDKKHARIYRVVYKGTKPDDRLDLSGATPQQLVDTLRHPNMLWRKHAQRLLVQRDQTDVVPQLLELVGDTQRDQIGLNVGAIHALWTLDGLKAIDTSQPEVIQAVYRALRHPSAGVRRNAVQVLPKMPESVLQLVESGVMNDSDAQVRLASALALADLPAMDVAGQLLPEALEDPSNAFDAWIPDAITSAAAKNSRFFLAAVTEQPSPGDKLLDVTQIVAQHFARSAAPAELIELLPILAESQPRPLRAILAGFAGGWPEGKALELTEQDEQQLVAIASRLSAADRGLLVQLSNRWGSQHLEKYAAEVVQSLLGQVAQEDLDAASRVEAARQLIAVEPRSSEIVIRILGVISPRTSPDLAAGLLGILEASQVEELPRAILEHISEWTPAARIAALELLLKRTRSTLALLRAIEDGEIALSELALDQRQTLIDHPDGIVRFVAERVLREGGSLPSPDRQRVLEELLPLAEIPGDAAQGKLAYEKHCSKCHIHSGVGSQVGPELTGMAVHPKQELLIHILDPSRSVEANFRSYTIVTADGLVLQGMLSAESQTAIELFDAEAKKHVVLREDIEQLVASQKSLMPDGFEQQMSREEMVDLLEFLTQRGRYLPLDLSRVATVHRLKGCSTAERHRLSDWCSPTGDRKRSKVFPSCWWILARGERRMPSYSMDLRGRSRPRCPDRSSCHTTDPSNHCTCSAASAAGDSRTASEVPSA